MVGIYKITNLKNNKCYIGQSVNINERFTSHKWYLKNNRHVNIKLQRAWNKYGEDNFKFEIIEECNKEVINEREIYFIKHFNACSSKGYNLTYGGNSEIPSEETKIKMSKAQTGKKSTKETRLKLSLSHIGQKSSFGMLGKKATDETKNKLSESSKKQYENKYKHLVPLILDMINKGITYTEIGTKLGYHYTTISKIVKRFDLNEQAVISNPKKRIKHSKETIEKRAKSNKGKIPWNKGKKIEGEMYDKNYGHWKEKKVSL